MVLKGERRMAVLVAVVCVDRGIQYVEHTEGMGGVGKVKVHSRNLGNPLRI